MNRSSLRKEAQLYFQPFLLGNNKDSRRLSRKIFKKYGVSSYILGEKTSFANLCPISHRFVRIVPVKDSHVMCLQLSELLAQTEDILPILIPCSKEHEAFISYCKSELEKDFILSTPTDVLEASPLRIIPQSKHKLYTPRKEI